VYLTAWLGKSDKHHRNMQEMSYIFMHLPIF